MEKPQAAGLGDMLLEANIISNEDLKRLLFEKETTNKRISRLMVELGMVSDEERIRFLKDRLGLERIFVSGRAISDDIIELIPKYLAHSSAVLPVNIDSGSLTLAMEDPTDLIVIDNIKNLTGYDVKPVLVSIKDLDDALDKYYGEVDSEVELVVQRVSPVKKFVLNIVWAIIFFLPLILFAGFIFIAGLTNPSHTVGMMDFNVILAFFLFWAIYVTIAYYIYTMISEK
jgi:MshEN domain